MKSIKICPNRKALQTCQKTQSITSSWRLGFLRRNRWTRWSISSIRATEGLHLPRWKATKHYCPQEHRWISLRSQIKPNSRTNSINSTIMAQSNLPQFIQNFKEAFTQQRRATQASTTLQTTMQLSWMHLVSWATSIALRGRETILLIR